MDQNEEPSPVPIIGTDLQAYSDDGSAVSFTLDASGSSSWNGNSITYLWEFPSGITITSGTTTTASVTIDVDPGVYVIVCTVTDSVTGKNKRAERWIFVNDASNDAFSDAYPVDNLQIRHDWNGLNVTFTAHGDVDASYLYTGAHVLITWEYEFSQDGATWTQPSEEALYRKVCKSYVRSFDVNNDSDGIKRYDFTCVDMITMCDSLPLAPQALIRTASPSDWTQVIPDLMNVAFLARQTISLNSGATLTMCDFDYDDFDTVTKENFKIQEKSIGEAFRRSARYIPGALVMQSFDGKLLMRRSYSYEPLATRATYPTRFTWNDTDILNEIGYNLNEIMRAGFTEGGAFVDGTTTSGGR